MNKELNELASEAIRRRAVVELVRLEIDRKKAELEQAAKSLEKAEQSLIDYFKKQGVGAKDKIVFVDGKAYHVWLEGPNVVRNRVSEIEVVQ